MLPVDWLDFLDRGHCETGSTKNDSCIVEVRTQNTSQGLDSVLVTAGGERADHIVVQL